MKVTIFENNVLIILIYYLFDKKYITNLKLPLKLHIGRCGHFTQYIFLNSKQNKQKLI